MPEQTDTDTIYILSASAPTQIDNMVGLADQLNLPAGYSRTRPDPTPTRGVYRVQRTRRFNVDPLALSQAQVNYDKTQASTVTLALATGGEPPITYSAPLVRGSQDRYDVPGAPVTFDPVTRELNIGSGFDEGLLINYTARDACNQVANAEVLVRPSATEHDAFRTSTLPSINLPVYTESVGRGATASGSLNLRADSLGLAPYTIRYQSALFEENGWQVSIVHDNQTPRNPVVTVVAGDWFTAEDSTRRSENLVVTDFLGRESISATVGYEYS